MPQRRKDLKIEGPNLWYLVGLITSDGCLSGDGRHIDITSKDYEFLNYLRGSLGLLSRVTAKYGLKKKQAFHIQIGNKNFYNFLLSIGLTPNKSLTLNKLNVPVDFFADFLRGLIDGDGCIRNWIHPTNKKEQWSLRIYSGSINFLEWLAKTIENILNARGKIYLNNKQGNCFVLKFGKMSARYIIQQCYYPGSLCLDRKNLLADECINSCIGWKKSKTADLLDYNYFCRGDGMEDIGALKAPVRKGVRVQLPPSA